MVHPGICIVGYQFAAEIVVADAGQKKDVKMA